MPRKLSGRPGGRPRHPDVITPAEERVLDRLRLGETNAEIAVRLGLSPETVKSHVSAMLSKLGLQDRRQLAAWVPGEKPSAGRGWGALAAGGIARAVRAALAGLVAAATSRAVWVGGLFVLLAAAAAVVGLVLSQRPRPGPGQAVVAVTASPGPPATTSPSATSPESTAVASPAPPVTATPTPAPVTPEATVRPGCREVVETVSRPDVTPDPSLTEDALVRSGAFRIVPEEYAGSLHYEYCPRVIDPGLPSADEAVLRASWLFVDLAPLAPDGYRLHSISAADVFPNLYVLQVLSDAEGHRIEVGRGLVQQLPIDINYCTPGPGCSAGGVEPVQVGSLSGILVRPGSGGGAGLPALYLYQDGVETVILTGHLGVRELLDFGARIAALPVPDPPPATAVDTTPALLDAVDRVLRARSGRLLGPCPTPADGPPGPGYCYFEPVLRVGDLLRLQLGRPASGAGLVMFVEKHPDGSYELVREIPYSY